ncbi:hypothetical protein D3C86_1220900 [compost metagenome]
MAKKKKTPRATDFALLEDFKLQAIKFQEASRTGDPESRRLNAVMGRKYLFHIIDELGDYYASLR